MPKLKVKRTPNDSLMALIIGYAHVRNMKISEILGVSYSTARLRIDNPDSLTLGELRKLSRALSIGADEVRAKIHL